MIKLLLKLLQKTASPVLNTPLFDKIRGYKTLIISTITILIGMVVFLQEQLNGEIGKMACEVGVTIFCNVAGSKFYGTIIIIIGFLNKVLRLVTDIPVPGFENTKNQKNG
jgi:hypothetical protein